MQKTVKQGAKGAGVRTARLLMGYEDGDRFDTGFAAFVRQWQKDRSLAADGVIGPETWRALAAEAKTVSVKKNASGPEALAAQLLLGGVKADGRFGPESRRALVRFQKAQGLTEDGVLGPAAWRVLLAGGAEKDMKVPDFKQYDARWAKNVYSNHADPKQTMRSSGCGPTAMADVAAALWDEEATPWTLARKSLDWGTRTRNSGTSGTFFACAAEWYKAGGYLSTASAYAARDCLVSGGLAVVNFGKSRWTNGGHYCCLRAYADGEFFICDPASEKAERARGSFGEVRAAAKRFYCFWK